MVLFVLKWLRSWLPGKQEIADGGAGLGVQIVCGL
jgi:hypothetical protein